jgi:hypothetical protein
MKVRCLYLAVIGYAVMRRFGDKSDIERTLSSLTRC